MPLTVYPSIYSSGSVPRGWKPHRTSPVKYPVANAKVLRHLRSLLPGEWQKVIKLGAGGEVHYYEHRSGQVAGLSFFER